MVQHHANIGAQCRTSTTSAQQHENREPKRSHLHTNINEGESEAVYLIIPGNKFPSSKKRKRYLSHRIGEETNEGGRGGAE